MNSNINKFLLYLFFLMIAAPALACDCAIPTDKDAFNSSPEVFTAEAARPIAHMGDKYMEVTTLRIETVFKGTAQGELLPKTDRGDCAPYTFEPGKKYLVFGSISGNIDLAVSLCSPTREIAKDQTCETDADCVAVPTSCGGCDCGLPVNTKAAEFYSFMHQSRCEGYSGAHCEMNCPGALKCVEQKCALVTDNPERLSKTPPESP